MIAERRTGVISCRGKRLEYGHRTLIMGILNVTPDSFSDGGKNRKLSDALFAAERMIREGADIIDVGGESTRPGYTMISVDEELERIAPVIERIEDAFDTVISVDTYKADVAEGALRAGAHIVNDIYGFMYDPKMAEKASEYDAAAVLMFNCRRNGECLNEDITGRAIRELSGSIERARAAGMEDDRLIVDPGIGFGTSRAQDIELIRSLDRISMSGRFPVLLAASRKRVAADILDYDTTPEERDAVTMGIGLAGVNNGASILRVHNVKMTYESLKGYESTIGG